MALEIERKFLVKKELWKGVIKPKGKEIRQGYLSLDPERTVRVRIKADKGYLTVKGKSKGASRSEFEYEIPKSEAEEMLSTLCMATLSKIRYEVHHQGKIWEVDEFLDANHGLLLAEIELESEEEHFTLPLWIGDEVTADIRYYNSNLIVQPFSSWPDIHPKP